MARTQEDLGRMVGKIFDRLERDWPDLEVVDAMILVELSDKADTITLESGDEVPATVVLQEATTDRVTVLVGIIDFTRENIMTRAEDDDD